MFNSPFVYQRLIPRIPKRYLLFLAGTAWVFAAIMLFSKGVRGLILPDEFIVPKMLVALLLGLLFYQAVFSSLSLRYSRRIIRLQAERPMVFSFFSGKSYLMMTVMISMGIALRMSGIIPAAYMSLFYFTMGTPLFISAFGFYYYGFNYSKALNTLGKA